MEAMDAFVNVSCKAVLFDMDGTLVDSTRVVELAWGWWAARHHLTLPTVLSFSHGRPTIATMEHFFLARDHTEELKEMASPAWAVLAKPWPCAAPHKSCMRFTTTLGES